MKYLFFIWILLISSMTQRVLAREQSPEDESSPEDGSKATIIDEWTAYSLQSGHFAVGTILEVGLGQGLMVGADPEALALGVKTVQAKWDIPDLGEDHWAVGIKYISVSRNSIWWGDMHRRFSVLSAQIIRPSLTWSNRISERLVLHSFWASGFGHSDAELSAEGKQQLYEAKHGTDSTADNHTFANRTMQAQSIAGFTEDRFQMTAEWERSSGDHILLSTRFERTRLEQLETFSLRMTLAQQWASDGFNIRLGGGPQYALLSGKDLDGEEIKAAGWLPTADLAFYWVF